MMSVPRGRPPADPAQRRVPVTVRLPFWLLDWLRSNDQSQSRLIERALIATYDLERCCVNCPVDINSPP